MRTDERESVQKSKKMQQILQADEFLFVMMLNVILLTIGLTIFNVCFLLIFMTSALKFYKTNIMEKHVDMIEIPLISTEQKTSICVHLFSIALQDVLTNKSLFRNLVQLGFVVGSYLVVKMVAFQMLLMIIVDVEYAYCLVKRRRQNLLNDHGGDLGSQVESKPEKSPGQSETIDSSLGFYSSTLKPIRSTLTQKPSELIQNFSQISQSPQRSLNSGMRMIEQEEEDRGVDQYLPEISTIKIVSMSSSIELN